MIFTFIFFHPHNFNFCLSKHKILKIKEFQLMYLKFLEFKIYQNFKFLHPHTLLRNFGALELFWEYVWGGMFHWQI